MYWLNSCHCALPVRISHKLYRAGYVRFWWAVTEYLKITYLVIPRSDVIYFHCLLLAKIKNIYFWKICKSIFRIFLTVSGHILRPRLKISIFQKVRPKFMESYSVWTRFYFVKVCEFDGAFFIDFLKSLF